MTDWSRTYTVVTLEEETGEVDQRRDECMQLEKY